MAYADDLELLKVYADPSLSREQKMAALQGPKLALGGGWDPPPPGLVPPDPAAAPPAEPPSVADVAPSLPAGAYEPHPDIARGAPVAVSDEAAVQAELASAGVVIPKKEEGRPTDAESEQAPQPSGPSAPEARDAITRWYLKGPPRGPAPKPTEQVRLESTIEKGAWDPETAAEYLEQAEIADNAQLEADKMAMAQDLNARQQRVWAIEDAQREREEQAEVQKRSAIRGAEIQQQIADVTQELAATPVQEPSLWAGKNFGEKLLTGLSLFFNVIHAGRNPESAIANIKEMAYREANQQKVKREKLGQDLGALETLYDRHMKATGDQELAHKFTVDSILQKAELEVEKMLLSPLATESTKQGLLAKQAALKADRLQRQAELQRALGDKVQQSEALAFVRERQIADRANKAATAGQPEPPPQPVSTGATGESLDDLDAQIRAAHDSGDDDAIRKLVGRALGQEPPKRPEPKPAAVARKPGSWVDEFHTNWERGDIDAAINGLPPEIERTLRQQADSLAKKEGISFADAANRVFKAQLGVKTGMVPEWARDRMVRINGQTLYHTGKPEHVPARLAAIEMDQELIRLGTKMLNIFDEPGARTSREKKARLDTIATEILPTFAVAKGQGALAEGELELYRGISGKALANYIGSVTTSDRAKVEQMVQNARARMRARMSHFSKDPYGDEQAGASYRTVP